ncbi:flagellar basal body P-ring formation chaperone FlgA [Polymorphum gilvum]|uniref:Flagella basal body P-ring formation protein FlgA n=1 Tax=Polymorphum gilvum (strain LMG 25793 / CGMCC 1.9160 / SL003B-26A1) TaxID=991905 RepID=F2J5D8_POLGS|nr:flagellar basal body P-ring formation chaperone FlgA [Polymorphum gilvum]ADZ72308.1 Flagellar basal body P-ring biosynthesis protein-like protein [Polymorphum gilvum SL003B-26A1]
MFVRLLICVFIAGMAASAALSGARAAGIDLPVPRVTIHPGDEIGADLLIERRFPANTTRQFAIVTSPRDLVGMVARRTLLPGQPVPLGAVAPVMLVKRGEPARLVFKEGGLFIMTQVEALQSGGAGAVVRVRNVDSGVIVTGTVQADGSILTEN